MIDTTDRMRRESGKVVWITGASSGIGEALAYYYAEAGAHLIISARSIAALIRVKEKCETHCVTVYIHPLDLEQTDILSQKAGEALAVFGRVDIIIHSGGGSQRALAQETRTDVSQRIMNVNFWGAVVITRSLLPHLLQKRSGRIVVISSLAGKFGTRLRSSYAASKHALHGYFDALRCEVEDQGIGITIVCPGFIKTNISCNALLANGDNYYQMDPAQAAGMNADICARKIGNAIWQGKREVNIGRREIYALLLKRLFPGIFFRVIKTAKVT